MLTAAAGARSAGHRKRCWLVRQLFRLCQVPLVRAAAHELAAAVAERLHLEPGGPGVHLGLYPIVTLEKQVPDMIGNLV